MTTGEAYKKLSLLLQAVYQPREANNIAGLVVEHITGFSGSERVIHKMDILTAEQEAFFQQATTALLSRQPVQYVLHRAYFYQMKFYVDEHVLIPRPETEELVNWVLEDAQANGLLDGTCTMLDVGTGSGCIAIALQKSLPNADVSAIDVSTGALEVARQNAENQKANIHFYEVDILDEEARETLPRFNYIISNPPYIKEEEAVLMSDNVVKFEPHVALFVPDATPLLFYEAISTFGLQHLKDNGRLFFEINEAFGEEVMDLLLKKGYKNIELKKDMQGKDRMIKANAPGTNRAL